MKLENSRPSMEAVRLMLGAWRKVKRLMGWQTRKREALTDVIWGLRCREGET
jgi:hypothetical protein